MRRFRSIVWFVVLAFGPACSRPDASAEWAGTVETLPGGATRVTNPRAGVWESTGGAWRLEPDLVLGAEEGTGADVFGSISALQVDDAGDIFVLDRQANELRIFDSAGKHLRSAGRAGTGPGEYTTANGLEWLGDDTLVVVDQEGARYSLLNRKGDYVRSVRRPLGFYGWVFDGGVDGDMIWEVSGVGPHDARRPVLLGTRLRGMDAADADVAMDARAADGTPRFAADTLYLAPPDGPLYETFSVRTKQAGMVMGVPFAGLPQYRVDGAGGVWFGHGGKAAIRHATFRGDTLVEILFDPKPVPVTSEEIDRWQASPGLERFRALGGKLDLDRIPKTKPYFDGIVLDPEGNVWLTVPAEPRAMVFTLLDPDGRYLGPLRIEEVARETYVSPVVRNGRLYFIGRDELDVQRVYVYRIQKSAGE